MNFIFKFIFLLTLIFGTLVSLSSNSWIGMWMGLEINLMSFIPLVNNNKNTYANESSIKYFLIQSFASLIFLFTIINYMMKMNFMVNSEFMIYNLIINSTMMLKLGAAPFHFWFCNIIEGLTWINTLLIMTWQKLAPLMIISYSLMNYIIDFFIIFSSIIGAYGGLNQTFLQKILVYSSINHMSWLMISMKFNNILWIYYFMLYFLINLSIIMVFWLWNIFNINQLFMLNNQNLYMKFFIMMNFLSLGGLPPFLGFLPKLMVIENLMKINYSLILFIMIMTSLITLYFYLRLTFSSFMLSYFNYSWKIFYTNFKNYKKIINVFNIMMVMTFFLILCNSFYLT